MLPAAARRFASTMSVGAKFPAVTLFEGTPGGAVATAELLSGRKVVVLGVPGAFTPGCSATHLPGYVKNAGAFKAKGVHEIVCVSVNDPFVMAAWGKAQGAEGKVRCLADTNAEVRVGGGGGGGGVGGGGMVVAVAVVAWRWRGGGGAGALNAHDGAPPRGRPGVQCLWAPSWRSARAA